jgi:pimeloyl-ACP methyl ester carboxylesterase
MRKAARALLHVVLALLSSVALGVASALTAAVTLAATALIVPGTGVPNANIVTNYLENARDRYIAPFNPSCTATSHPSCTLTGINYPASFWPLPFPGWCVPGRCEKWNDSVGQGVDALSEALAPYLDPNSKEQVVIFGYSQGGAVVSNVLQNLGDLPQSVKDRLAIVTIGGVENPDGGLWSRLGFLPTIPIFDITFGPPMTVDTGIPMTTIGFEYDPVV